MIDFTHSEEQQMIAESLDRLAYEKYPLVDRFRSADGQRSIAPSLWQDLTELGLAALLVPEEFGGLGGNMEDVMVVMERVGAHLLASPLLHSGVLATVAIASTANGKQKSTWLPAVAEGQSRAAIAITEPNDYALPNVFKTRFADGKITGKKSLVHFAEGADFLIVAAQFGSEQVLCRVETDAQGLQSHVYPTHDGGHAADLVLDDVPAEVLGDGADAGDVVRLLWDIGAVAVCAEALGCMDSIYVQTRDYLTVREQFGAPLISNQTLQHRLVDMHMDCELSRAMTCEAVWAIDNSDATERHRSVCSAKVLIGQGGNRVGKEGIQLHGGIGMTRDLPIGHYFKRLTAINLQFGDCDNRLVGFQRSVENL
ncbi:MAG: acyl-CoA dehydrogenase family protein [Pseudomonadota bacterium]